MSLFEEHEIKTTRTTPHPADAILEHYRLVADVRQSPDRRRRRRLFLGQRRRG
jgi:hypothetical protein